jgi:hypothetical protein
VLNERALSELSLAKFIELFNANLVNPANNDRPESQTYDRAQSLPSRRGVSHAAHVRDVLRHHDGEPGVEVPVDVAVEEPRARVVGGEPDGDVVACAPGRDGIPLDWVDVVVLGGVRRTDDGELVAVEVERVSIFRVSVSALRVDRE